MCFVTVVLLITDVSGLYNTPNKVGYVYDQNIRVVQAMTHRLYVDMAAVSETWKSSGKIRFYQRMYISWLI